jgi:hypothetical protein
MAMYVGLDVSLKMTESCDVDDAGRRARRGRSPSTGQTPSETACPPQAELSVFCSDDRGAA